jgi:hypothetical protein
VLESKLSQLGSYGLARMRSPILWGGFTPKPKTLQAMFLFFHSPKCLKASFRNWEVMDWLACARPSFGGLYSKTQNIASHVFVSSFPQMLESKLSQLGE